MPEVQKTAQQKQQQKPKPPQQPRCAVCKRPLSDATTWRLPAKLGRKYVPLCVTCQEQMFLHLSSILGYKLATFVCCAAFNMPYMPEVFSESKKYINQKTFAFGRVGVWSGYYIALKQKGYDKSSPDKSCAGFTDGLTNIEKAFDGKTATLYISDEMLDAEEYQEGKVTQEAFWGRGPEAEPYTDADYEVLTKTYNALASNRQYRSDQTDLAMQKIARWTLEQERSFNKGDFNTVEKLQKIIKTEMEGEQLRKKDELPQDTVRLDDIVQALERKGIPMMDYEELATFLANHAIHAPYPYCRDAADQMLLMIRNATAWNEGREELQTLPPEFSINDTMGEFAEKPDEKEKENYKAMNLLPMHLKNPVQGETKDG